MKHKNLVRSTIALMGVLMMNTSSFASTFGIVKINGVAQKAIGDVVQIVHKEDGHYTIKLDDNTAVPVKRSDIEVNSVLATISVEGANLRAKADPSAPIDAKLAKETVVSAHYRYVDWYYVKSAHAEGFVYKSQIEGEDLSLLEHRKATQEKKQTQQAKQTSQEAPIENLDWWSSARYVFPRGAVAVIEDARTGKTFSIKRTFGTNHADVEALTAKDTATMKEIWGGFSWERRPVIVHINGRRIAASMVAMPHAGKDSAPALAVTNNLSGGYGRGQNLDMVKGNNMDGVVDLHFLNSKRHKDGKVQAVVDPAHQKAIQEAMRIAKAKLN